MQAARARRDQAGDSPWTDVNALGLYNQVGGHNTVSIGFMQHKTDGNFAFYASQNGAAWDGPLPSAYDGYERVNATTGVVGNKAAPTGLHAEMIIIRYLFKNGYLTKGQEAADADAIKLRIVCTNKKVCADCSGWLKAHSIPHYPTDSVAATTQWVHPRTGALYAGGKNVRYYINAGLNNVPIRTDDYLPAAAGYLGRL